MLGQAARSAETEIDTDRLFTKSSRTPPGLFWQCWVAKLRNTCSCSGVPSRRDITPKADGLGYRRDGDKRTFSRHVTMCLETLGTCPTSHANAEPGARLWR